MSLSGSRNFLSAFDHSTHKSVLEVLNLGGGMPSLSVLVLSSMRH